MIGHCEICYQDIAEGQQRLFCTTCDQDFHTGCISIHLKTKNTCPICKASFTLEKMALGASKKRHAVNTMERRSWIGASSGVDRSGWNYTRTRPPLTERKQIQQQRIAGKKSPSEDAMFKLMLFGVLTIFVVSFILTNPAFGVPIILLILISVLFLKNNEVI